MFKISFNIIQTNNRFFINNMVNKIINNHHNGNNNHGNNNPNSNINHNGNNNLNTNNNFNNVNLFKMSKITLINSNIKWIFNNYKTTNLLTIKFKHRMFKSFYIQ